MQTVGDQIFALTKEIKQLRKRCRQYEDLLRLMAEQKAPAKQASLLAEQALADAELEPA